MSSPKERVSTTGSLSGELSPKLKTETQWGSRSLLVREEAVYSELGPLAGRDGEIVRLGGPIVHMLHRLGRGAIAAKKNGQDAVQSYRGFQPSISCAFSVLMTLEVP